MIKDGQIYKQQNGEIFVVSQVCRDVYISVIYSDGYVQNYDLRFDVQDFLFHEKIAEYPTWRKAVNSKEFNNG